MKIIVCIFLLNITAVSVFGKELNHIVGESVKFPAEVKKGGSLMYGTLPIGDVTSSRFMALPNEKFSSRLQWDSSTGLFSLSGLKLEDSGEYKVQNTDQNINTVFQLNVYIPVSKPHVSITQNEYPCTIECTAESGTGATLSWYREGEKKSFVFSRVESAPGLYLPAPVKRSGTYTCEAKNSVSNEKASITVGAHCTASSSTGIIVASVIAAVAILIAVVFAVLYYYIRRRQAVRTLIQVKKLLDDVDLHAYDETDPPDAVRPFILVKKFLYYVDQHAYAVRHFSQVKKILRNVDPHECDGTVSPDAVETFIQVKELLDNVDPHVCAFKGRRKGDAVQTVPQSDVTMLPLTSDDRRTLIQGVNTLMEVKKLIDNVDPHAYAVGALIQVKNLIDDVDPRAYSKFIYQRRK